MQVSDPGTAALTSSPLARDYAPVTMALDAKAIRHQMLHVRGTRLQTRTRGQAHKSRACRGGGPATHGSGG